MNGPWLVVLPYIPFPITRGTFQRTYHLTRALGNAVTIDLFCLAENGEGLDQADAFSGFARRIHFEEFYHPPWPKLIPDRLFSRLPSTVRHWQSPLAGDKLRNFVAGQCYAGVVFCDLVLWPYIQEVFPDNCVRVMDRSRVDWLFQSEELNTLDLSIKERLLRMENLFKIARLERSAYKALSGEIVCGPDDKSFLAGKLADVNKVHVLANGYNESYFDYNQWRGTPTANPSVLFCGALDYTPNMDCLDWYLKEIHDRILSAIPDYSFMIVGRNPSAALRKSADKAGVHFIGEVPDVRPWYQKAWIQAVPLRIGGGTRLKITESLAMCTPVVSTSLGAQGLDLRDGKDILLADSTEAFSNAVIRVLKDAGLRSSLEKAGLAAVREKYTWTSLGNDYVSILERIQDAQR